MTNGWKKQASYLWRRLKRLPAWQMALALAGLVLLCVFFLRLNNVIMADLRDQVIIADQQGSDTDVAQAAKKLRDFVEQHMNADTGLIALQNRYNAAVQTAFASANTDIDSSGYAAAAESCKTIIPQGGYKGYAACVADSVGLGDASLKTPDMPNPALYYISYASPLLSFDLAGVLTILATVVFFAIILKFTTEVGLYIVLRYRHKYSKTLDAKVIVE